MVVRRWCRNFWFGSEREPEISQGRAGGEIKTPGKVLTLSPKSSIPSEQQRLGSGPAFVQHEGGLLHHSLILYAVLPTQDFLLLVEAGVFSTLT